MSHPWKSGGDKRTVVWEQEQPDELVRYLTDMQDAIRYALQVAYRDAIADERQRVPSPITLRKEVRE
ncbi:MAG: hypothetical protein JRM80_09890 [Nitrososphaerota archaeon]|nr:hypothetical protein [Nitrososphaerota archaeon]